jgi:hypothetical protein
MPDSFIRVDTLPPIGPLLRGTAESSDKCAECVNRFRRGRLRCVSLLVVAARGACRGRAVSPVRVVQMVADQIVDVSCAGRRRGLPFAVDMVPIVESQSWAGVQAAGLSRELAISCSTTLRCQRGAGGRRGGSPRDPRGSPQCARRLLREGARVRRVLRSRVCHGACLNPLSGRCARTGGSLRGSQFGNRALDSGTRRARDHLHILKTDARAEAVHTILARCTLPAAALTVPSKNTVRANQRTRPLPQSSEQRNKTSRRRAGPSNPALRCLCNVDTPVALARRAEAAPISVKSSASRPP